MEGNALSLLLLVIGSALILIEIVAFTFKLLVLGIAALLMSLACYLFPVPAWGLAAFGIIAILVQFRIARTYPRVAGIPAVEVIGQAGYVANVTAIDSVTHATITFSKPFGGKEQWDIKQTEPLKNQSRAVVLKVNEDSTLTVGYVGETTK